MSFNVIQNYLRKSFIGISLVLGMVAFSVPQISSASDIETADFNISLYPLAPSISDELEISVHPRSCFVAISLGSVVIDTLNKDVSINIEESDGICFGPQEFTLPIGKLIESGVYTVSVYLDGITPNSLIGSFPLAVAQDNTASPIPLFSNTVLAILFLILLMVGVRTIRTTQFE